LKMQRCPNRYFSDWFHVHINWEIAGIFHQVTPHCCHVRSSLKPLHHWNL
jgi:hypothetical protein